MKVVVAANLMISSSFRFKQPCGQKHKKMRRVGAATRDLTKCTFYDGCHKIKKQENEFV